MKFQFSMNPNGHNPTGDHHPIATLVEFWAEIDRLPERVPLGLEKWSHEMKAAGVDPNLFTPLPDNEEKASPYASWFHLRHLIEHAVKRNDTQMVALCFDIASRTLEAGDKGEMWKASYVSFIEDLRLPPRRKHYERILRLMPPTLHEIWISQRPRARRPRENT